MKRTQGFAVTFDHRGEESRMFVVDPHDIIQGHHWNGDLDETEELAIIAETFQRYAHTTNHLVVPVERG
ncbi:MAG: hypothetical protein P4L66_12610 [Acetobacteraceae bacterium]|nr:hypothetical protein [Acetobacteraceae bacterium]